MRMGFREINPSLPPELHYLFGIPERIANNLYDVGKATVSQVPRAESFPLSPMA